MKIMDHRKTPAEATTLRHQHAAEASVGGALAGAALGAIGGPPGAVAGAVIGGVIAAVATEVIEQDEDNRALHDKQLDEEIGVYGGELGAPNLKHPPARHGLYSAASAGVSSGPTDSAPAEGPLGSAS